MGKLGSQIVIAVVSLLLVASGAVSLIVKGPGTIAGQGAAQRATPSQSGPGRVSGGSSAPASSWPATANQADAAPQTTPGQTVQPTPPSPAVPLTSTSGGTGQTAGGTGSGGSGSGGTGSGGSGSGGSGSGGTGSGGTGSGGTGSGSGGTGSGGTGSGGTGSGSGGTGSGGSGSGGTHCYTGAWPDVTKGGPVHAGAPAGVYVTDHGDTISVTVTHPGTWSSHFVGTATTNGTFLITPAWLEAHDTWQLSPDGHTVTFNLDNHGRLDAVQLTPECGSYVTIQVDQGDHPSPLREVVV
ncbi:MAG TPA: hypothetical protein VED63_04455, partial [Acidimicrobiales bacterium]|nr:hypothetical protein [Acidimicrobiales bacterium]